MVNAIHVNGRLTVVLNALSTGPGNVPHTYELSSGAYVYAVGSEWWLQERGREKRRVDVIMVAA